MVLTDERRKKIEQLLPGKASDPGRTAKDNRLFVEAVL
uniref:Transposase n=1 Tax=Aromatoleum buckelii TaxID=200254 RepID=A0ABX1N343_9RHOO